MHGSVMQRSLLLFDSYPHLTLQEPAVERYICSCAPDKKENANLNKENELPNFFSSSIAHNLPPCLSFKC